MVRRNLGVQPNHRCTTLVVQIFILFSYQKYDFRCIDIYISFNYHAGMMLYCFIRINIESKESKNTGGLRWEKKENFLRGV